MSFTVLESFTESITVMNHLCVGQPEVTKSGLETLHVYWLITPLPIIPPLRALLLTYVKLHKISLSLIQSASDIIVYQMQTVMRAGQYIFFPKITANKASYLPTRM